MIQVNNILEKAERQCQQRGVRLTHKRKQVLSGLVLSQKALSAYELIDYCKTELGETLPAMSVYRILDFLQDEQLVHKLNLENKYVACAHIACDHSHEISQFLICGQCQKVSEISIDESVMNEIKQSVTAAGYHLLNPQLEMNCLCSDCATQNKKR